MQRILAGVQKIYNGLYEKLTGKHRVPYKGNNITIDGMPEGINVKNPQKMGYQRELMLKMEK